MNKWSLLICTLLFVGNIFGQDLPLIFEDENEVVSLKGFQSLFEDTSADLTIKEVQEKTFVDASDRYPNAGFTSSAIWIKFSITNQSNTDQLRVHLESTTGILGKMYHKNAEGEWKEQLTGNLIPMKERSVQSGSFAFDLDIPIGSSKTCFVRLTSNEHILIPMSVAGRSLMAQNSSNGKFWFGIFAGIFFALILYNLFVYISLRERSYLIYVLHTAFSLITQATFLGYASQFLWPESIWLAFNGKTIFTCLVSLVGIEFMKEFLITKRNAPVLNRIANGFEWVYGGLIVLNILGFYDFVYTVLSPLQALAVSFVLYTSFVVNKRGFRPARFFILSWIFFLIGILVYVMAIQGILIPFNDLTTSFMPLGSVMEILLLSFALADKIQFLKQERDEADKKVLEMALSNEKIVREQNIMLEQKVKERTNDLEETVSKLDNAYSNLKEAQSQLVNKEKMASMGQLTAGIAHEINNPINFISGSITPLTRDIEEIIELFDETDKLAKDRFSPEEYAQIEDLKEDLDYEYLKTEIDELLKGMNDGSKRTVSIIRGLKTFSRVDESDTKSVDIHDNIESTLVLINNQIKNSIEVIRNYGSLPMVECFAGQINQVFLNLINNAAQAINEAKVESEKGTIWIATSFQETDQTVQISIKDNGPGIPDEIIDRIFDPFFTTKDVGEGTGLGLSISYNIIEKHGGELKVKTEAGKGTEFVITLPLSPKPKK